MKVNVEEALHLIETAIQESGPDDWVLMSDQPEEGVAKEALLNHWRVLVVYGGPWQQGAASQGPVVIRLTPELAVLARQKASRCDP